MNFREVVKLKQKLEGLDYEVTVNTPESKDGIQTMRDVLYDICEDYSMSFSNGESQNFITKDGEIITSFGKISLKKSHTAISVDNIYRYYTFDTEKGSIDELIDMYIQIKEEKERISYIISELNF